MSMSNKLTREQIVDLLNFIGVDNIKDYQNKDNIQFCCPIHGETHPSAGVSVEKQMFNCFSCHAKGDLAWLLFKSKEDIRNYAEAEEILAERYGIEIHTLSKRSLKSYEELQNSLAQDNRLSSRVVKPIYTLAPYKSGKETYKYFYKRGFTKETREEYKIGRDLVSKTVTVPLFWRDKTLAGIIGRYVSSKRRHNERYKIYDELNTGSVMYPLDRYQSDRHRVVLVEGLLDALWLHQLGFKEALALLTNNISYSQTQILLKELHVSEVVDFTDNDDMGSIATKSLRDMCHKNGLKYMTCKHLYTEGCKDPQDMCKEDIEYILDNAVTPLKTRRLKRI